MDKSKGAESINGDDCNYYASKIEELLKLKCAPSEINLVKGTENSLACSVENTSQTDDYIL